MPKIKIERWTHKQKGYPKRIRMRLGELEASMGYVDIRNCYTVFFYHKSPGGNTYRYPGTLDSPEYKSMKKCERHAVTKLAKLYRKHEKLNGRKPLMVQGLPKPKQKKVRKLEIPKSSEGMSARQFVKELVLAGNTDVDEIYEAVVGKGYALQKKTVGMYLGKIRRGEF